MPAKVRDSKLDTRTARKGLEVRPDMPNKPYYRLIEPGLHLGYRKRAGEPGTWVVRRYGGEGRYVVENLRTSDGRLVIADDYSEPDGNAVLSFAQAQERAKAFRPGADGRNGSYRSTMRSTTTSSPSKVTAAPSIQSWTRRGVPTV